MSRTLALALPLSLGLLWSAPSSAAYLRLIPSSGNLQFFRDLPIQFQVLAPDAPITIRTITFAITFDAARLNVTLAPDQTPVFTGYSSLTYNPGPATPVDGDLGSITGTLTVASPNGLLLTQADPLAAVLNLLVSEKLSPLGGTADVNIRADYNGVTTAINGGGIALNPAPTNGFDTGVNRDARFGVTAVPEPGSVVLLGLGMAGLGWRRVRRAGR